MKLSKGEAIGFKEIADYMHLYKSDIINSSEWKYAQVLVSTNLERKSIFV